VDNSPTLFATDRADRVTYIAQGWKVTDPQALAGVWCAQFTNGAGEDIRYLPRDKAGAPGLPSHDYWLLDSRVLVRMHFDDRDAFLGGEVIEDAAEIVQHNYWRDAAWHHATRRDDFAAEQHLGRV
jgi:hypothetical protein